MVEGFLVGEVMSFFSRIVFYEKKRFRRCMLGGGSVNWVDVNDLG